MVEAKQVCKIVRLLTLVSLFVLVPAFVFDPSPVRASASGWSAPALLFQTEDAVVEPDVVVDQTGVVHVFWVTRLSSVKRGAAATQLFYTRLRGGNWSTPTDVIAMSDVSAPSAAVDPAGVVSLFWHVVSGDLFRSQSAVDDAVAAANWARPTDVGRTNNSSEVSADSRGRLHLIYPGAGSSGVYYQYSDDSGQTWSFPVNVSPAAPNATAEFPRLAVGPEGTIHVVWTEFRTPNGWPPLGVFYARSIDDGKSWSAPLRIAEQGFTQGNVAAGPKGSVFIAWNGMSGIQGRYSRQSMDGGVTWSAPSLLKPPLASTNDIGGSTGPPGLVVDSAGNAHVLFVQDNRVWYSAWKGGTWTLPEYVPSGNEGGLPPENQPISGSVRHIEQAVMTLGLGNQLHVVFWDVRQKANATYVWYTTKKLDLPGVAPREFSVAAVPTVEQRTPTPVTTTEPSSVPSAGASTRAVRSRPLPPDSRAVMALGLLPVAIVLASFTAIRVWALRK